MVNKWIRLYLTIANTTTLPKWIRYMNSMQTIFAILCVMLMKVQDQKEQMVKQNDFAKKYRLVVRPIEIETEFGTLRMQQVIAIPKEDKKETSLVE